MEITTKQKADGWRIVKFGDVAREVTASTRDPLGEGIERYVGLEHIDPESLRLARYGLIAEDNPTFTKKFSAGDILFGRRRAYLKKAAVADFDGICSGDITVIAPKGDALVQGLLPFIVQSDSFFDWAVKHSAGGLSPRTKFKSLEGYEFQLPSPARQEEVLVIFQKIEHQIFLHDEIALAIDKCKKSIFVKHNNSNCEQKKVNEVCKNITGGGTPNRAKKEYYNGNILWVKTKELNDSFVSETEEKITALGLRNSSAKLLEPDTVLMAMFGATVGKLGILTNYATCNQACCAMKLDKSVMLPEYLFYSLLNLRSYFINVATGAAQPNINMKIILNTSISCPPIYAQKKLIAAIQSCDQFIKLNQQKAMQLKKVKKKFLSDMLK